MRREQIGRIVSRIREPRAESQIEEHRRTMRNMITPEEFNSFVQELATRLDALEIWKGEIELWQVEVESRLDALEGE